MGTSSDKLILDGIQALLDKQSRPGHVGVPRKRMELPFAVLLMRSSYNIADELNYYPMDAFQKNFFLYRQSEWEGYRDYHPTVLQGDLADPVYFDFISFCQYVTLGYSMQHAAQEFVEKVGADGENVVVRRNPQDSDDKMLPYIHSDLVGERILSSFYEKYPQSILPPANPSTATSAVPLSREKVVEYYQLLLDIFTMNSYCLSATIIDVTSADEASKGVLVAKLDIRAPSNLWSELALRKRDNNPLNDFEVKTLSTYGRRAGIATAVTTSSLANNIDVTRILRITWT